MTLPGIPSLQKMGTGLQDPFCQIGKKLRLEDRCPSITDGKTYTCHDLLKRSSDKIKDD